MKIQSWQTAIVLVVFIAAWVVLAVMGKPIPAWMAAAGAIVGKVILAILPPAMGKPALDETQATVIDPNKN